MIVSVFSDGEKKDKIADFYDCCYPTTFLRGILEEARELEKDTQLTFSCRTGNSLPSWDQIPTSKNKGAK